MTTTTGRTVLARGRAPRLGSCVRCYIKKPATVLKSLVLGEDSYDFPLCETHADLFETQMYAWTRVGQLVMVAPPPWTAERAEKLPVPRVAAQVVEEVEDEPAAWQDTLPEDVREQLKELPQLRDWRLSRKARERAGEQGIELFAILVAAEAPSQAEPSRDDEDVALHTRGNITAVVNTSNRTVLTAYRRKEGTLSGTQAS